MDDDLAPVEIGLKARVTRRGTISVKMTADELLTLAVNVADGWSLEDLGLDQTANPAALRKMLAEVYEQLLWVNRLAVVSGRRVGHRGRSIRSASQRCASKENDSQKHDGNP